MDGGATPSSEDQQRAPLAHSAASRQSASRVALLGPTRVEPGLSAEDLGQPKQRELFAVLALHAGAVVSHGVFAEALWEGKAPRTYTHSLQLYVSALRRSLTAAGSRLEIETHRQGYRLAVDQDDVDLFRFARLVHAGVADVARGRWQQGSEQLEDAMALWRGPALADFTAREFGHEAAAAAQRQRLDGLESLATARLEQGDSEAARRAAAEVVAADGLRERARSVLMVALYRTGRTAEALRTYEGLRQLLDDELGAAPSTDLRQLHARVLRHDPTLLAPGDRPRDPADRGSAGGQGAVVEPATRPPATPAPEQSRRHLRSRRSVGGLAIAGAAVVAVATLLVPTLSSGSVSGQRGTAAPGTALLLHHPGGEVEMLVEDGFDRAVTDFGLVGKDLTTDDTNAEIWIDEHVTAGAMLLDLTIDTDTAAAARRHPDTLFVALDHVEVEEPNVATLRFSSHEAAYLAGFAAARTSVTGTVGFMGGVDYEPIWPFEAGFEAGARAADPAVRVLTRYLSEPPRYAEGFLAPEGGERVASALFADGADVVFAAAGTSGLGVFEAATQGSTPARQLWAIGVDTDQYETVAALPGTVDVSGWRRHILTSVVLRYDKAVYSALAAYSRDEFRPGLHRYDLANGGVEISFSGGYLDDLRSQIDTIRRSIADGQITVPCRPMRLTDDPAGGC
jgi:basic membrane protein A